MSKSAESDVAKSATVEIPIFPLSAVLFPEGVLPLRIFEARYMDMVRDCLKSETRFGVCLITDGGEVGQPAEHTSTGCAAAITEWDMEQLGLLNIRTIGQERFSIETARTEKSGLIIANVSFIEPECDVQVPAEYAACVPLLERIVRGLVEKETNPMRKMIEAPYRFESSSWVSNRLCEFLPIPAPTKHKLMMVDDPVARLTVVHDFLKRQGII
ncbi:MAG: LON peptidase substrate-binding domain-containing protein [Burkholderiaceae bacterium]